MRHGESQANRQGLICSSPDNALDEFGLTAKGAEQVMHTALNTRLGTDTLLVTSDFRRARESAEIMKSVLSCTTSTILEPLLRERNFGSLELEDHSNYDSIWQNDVKDPENSFNGVETVGSVLKRGLSTIQKLERNYLNQTILMVGHGDVLQILLSHHHNVNPRFHRSLSSMGNADIRSLSKLELSARSPAA